MPANARFYQLSRSTLAEALAQLLPKALEAGWRVAVRGTDAGRLAVLDRELWHGPEGGFLPHGLAGGAQDAAQPVLLTLTPGAPNGAACLMAVDGAAVSAVECEGLERLCVIFDGADEAALTGARGQWRALTQAGIKAQYWSEAGGRWEMKAEA